MCRTDFISRCMVVGLAILGSLSGLPTSTLMAKSGCRSSSTYRGYVTRPASRVTVAKTHSVAPTAGITQAGDGSSLPETPALGKESAEVNAQLSELSRRLEQHLERCKEKAEVAEAKQVSSETKVSEHAKSLESSEQLIVFARHLLAKNETTIRIGEKEFTKDQIGSLLATLVDEHQKLIEQGRKLRIEAAAAAAESEGADQQLARWKQQQVELERIVDSLIKPNASGSQQSGRTIEADNLQLAQNLATRLEALLPPPAPAVAE